MSPNSPDADPNAVEVATGDRRDEVHFEADPDQLVVARHLVRPNQLPPDIQPGEGSAVEPDSPPVEDVRVAPDAPSVWDARPAADDAAETGIPSGR